MRLLGASSFAQRPTVYWPLNEGGGITAYDRSAHGNNGSLSATGATWIAGRFGGPALSLDGSAGVVSLAPPAIGTSGTICQWISPAITINANVNQGTFSDSDSNNVSILSRWDDGSPGGALRWYYYDGSFHSLDTLTTLWSAGKWYHVAFSWDSTTIRLYVNGAQESSTAAGTETAQAGNWLVGAGANGASIRYFNGRIDTFLYFPYALSVAEVQSLYTRPFGWLPMPRRRFVGSPAAGLEEESLTYLNRWNW
jgi:hypothetical protein